MDGVEPRGLLPPFLLLLIHERPAHGYDLIHRLVRLGVADPEPGYVYRVLRNLERRRLLASVWVASDSGPARRRYELTPRGLADLESWMKRLAELRGLLGAGLSRWAEASGSAPPSSAAASPPARPSPSPPSQPPASQPSAAARSLSAPPEARPPVRTAAAQNRVRRGAASRIRTT